MLQNQENKNNSDLQSIELAKQNIMKQAGLAGMAILITVVLVFAMAVAWYSNVIHTEGLVFETSSWDFTFEGAVDVGDDAWKIAPGDSGIIPLQITNSGDEPVTILANVTKDSFPSSYLKERIYFYVDANEEVNGENLSRVYINETDDYAYRLLSGETLTLNDNYHSHPYLKWEWVYDVLGYYVTGTMDESGKMTIEDYMRPVTYELDAATFDEDGNLAMTDADTSREDFLKELYLTDGYSGTYPDAGLTMTNGYYPVEVDEETGYGVWLYLATETDILADTVLDTQLATSGETITFTAKLLLSGKQTPNVVSTAGTTAELAAQLNGDNDMVILAGNMALTDAVTVASGTDTVLDLGGYTLTLEDTSSLIGLEEGSSLIVQNGVISCAGGSAFETVGGELTLNNVNFTDAKIAIQIRDNTGTGMDSYVRISNCNIVAEQAGVMVRGNGDASGRKTYVLIENSTIEGGWYGILGNGSLTGTEFEIIGSNLKGGWSGIYLPQKDSITTISSSTIEGGNGISMKAGTLNILDGTTILGTGEKEEPVFQSSGCSSTGDAIYIETNYGTEIKLTVTGNTTALLSTNSYALQVYEPDAEQVTVEITGGVFSSDVSEFLGEGYEIIELADGTFKVGQKAASVSQ